MLKKAILLLILACLPWSSAAAQTSYGSYYQKNIKKPYQQIRGGQSVNDYLFDKYYKGNRSVSPYANLNRGMSGTGYQTQVRPEQQRRAQFQSGLKTYVTDKKFDEAKKALDTAISLNDKNAVAYNYLGSWAMKQDRWEDTEKYLLKSIEINDSNQYANLNYAQFLMLRDRHREALPFLEKSYELDPGVVFTLYWYGRYYYKEKNYDKAYYYYMKALDQDPAFWAARTEISDMYLELGQNYNKALSVMKSGLQNDPRNQKGYYYHLTKLTLADNKPKTALNYSEKAQKLVKDSEVTERSEIHLLRGKIFEKLGKPDKARSEYKTVMAINPGSPFAKEAGRHISN